jgi:hypothetical protein
MLTIESGLALNLISPDISCLIFLGLQVGLFRLVTPFSDFMWIT